MFLDCLLKITETPRRLPWSEPECSSFILTVNIKFSKFPEHLQTLDVSFYNVTRLPYVHKREAAASGDSSTSPTWSVLTLRVVLSEVSRLDTVFFCKDLSRRVGCPPSRHGFRPGLWSNRKILLLLELLVIFSFSTYSWSLFTLNDPFFVPSFYSLSFPPYLPLSVFEERRRRSINVFLFVVNQNFTSHNVVIY